MCVWTGELGVVLFFLTSGSWIPPGSVLCSLMFPGFCLLQLWPGSLHLKGSSPGLSQTSSGRKLKALDAALVIYSRNVKLLHPNWELGGSRSVGKLETALPGDAGMTLPKTQAVGSWWGLCGSCWRRIRKFRCFAWRWEEEEPPSNKKFISPTACRKVGICSMVLVWYLSSHGAAERSELLVRPRGKSAWRAELLKGVGAVSSQGWSRVY